VTLRRAPPSAVRSLPLTVVGARVGEIAAASSARELAIACRAARRAAHPLRRPRGRGGLERLAALGASAAHPPSVGSPSSGGSISRRGPRHRHAADWITIPPRGGSVSGRRWREGAARGGDGV